ncbi:unnamed protein product [Chrysodeixis includens]|uniref:Uncharacterized protein n=1 Tax=Chrysodeixis includens TaxID=689277 RepID=A0A9P0FPC4_CHRIL|nr:unnamed protein product [Chrysodeixis includens]
MASSLPRDVKIEDLCRTCLSKDNELFGLYNSLDSGVPLDIVVSTVTGLKIRKDDGYPCSICSECKESASKAFAYKRKSEYAFASLRVAVERENKSQNNDLEVKTEVLSTDNDDMSDTIDHIDSTDNHDITDNLDITDNNETMETTDNNDDYDSDDNNDGTERSFIVHSRSTKLDPVKKEVLEVKFACVNCSVDFDTPNELQEHNKSCIKVESDAVNSNYCPPCETYFNSAENLTKHMWENHREIMGPKKRGRPKKVQTSTILNKLSENGFCITPVAPVAVGTHQCGFCKKTFATKEEVYAHFITHAEKVLCCGQCTKVYIDQDAFKKHQCVDEQRPSEENLRPNEDGAGQEQNEAESPEKKTIIREITIGELLNPNAQTGLSISLCVCDICYCLVLSESELDKHRDAEHPEASRRCNLCTKQFASIRSAARHRAVCKHHERKFKCTTCGLRFAFEISLNKHILRYHEGQSVSVQFIDSKTKLEKTQYQCDTCGRNFYKRELLIKHTKIHTPLEKFYECDVCQKKFHRRDNLRSHKRVHEVQENKSQPGNCLCLYCGRSFSNSSNLIVHMRRHTGEKPYKCDFCDKGFPRSSDLQCHRRSHTGEKPCVCRVCGKGFSRSNKLSRHMRVHTGQRPYKCTYCEKAFSQSNDLNLHIRRHTGDRPYNCEVCGDRFIQGTALQNHRRAHGHFTATVPTAGETSTHAFTVQNLNPTNHTI